jgi:hypothetical protein
VPAAASGEAGGAAARPGADVLTAPLGTATVPVALDAAPVAPLVGPAEQPALGGVEPAVGAPSGGAPELAQFPPGEASNGEPPTTEEDGREDGIITDDEEATRAATRAKRSLQAPPAGLQLPMAKKPKADELLNKRSSSTESDEAEESDAMDADALNMQALMDGEIDRIHSLKAAP